jgi:nicotinamide-nucleotide adenylyltransferase
MQPFRGFFIGRFQPFHNGHLRLAENITADIDEFVVGIGSAGDSHTVRNPFTAGERVTMITKALEPLGITTYAVPIEDLNRHSVWVSHVQSMSPQFDVAYSNNPLVVQLFREAGVEVRETDMFDRDHLKGSEVRDLMIEGKNWQQYVPDAVVDVVKETGGVDRIQRVSEVGGSSDSW